MHPFGYCSFLREFNRHSVPLKEKSTAQKGTELPLKLSGGPYSFNGHLSSRGNISSSLDSSARELDSSHLDADASSSTNEEWIKNYFQSDANTSSWNLEAEWVSNCYLPDLNSWSSSDAAWEVSDNNSNAEASYDGNLSISRPTVTIGVCDSQLVPVARPPLRPAPR